MLVRFVRLFIDHRPGSGTHAGWLASMIVRDGVPYGWVVRSTARFELSPVHLRVEPVNPLRIALPKENEMKLVGKTFGNPNRELELEEHLDIDITELLARAADAGYSEEEAIVAILNVAKYQSYVHGCQPDPKDGSH